MFYRTNLYTALVDICSGNIYNRFIASLSICRAQFFAGLLIVFITWMILYIFKDMANDSVMSDKIANLFSLKSNNWLFVVSSLIMGIIGGLTSLSAFFFAKINSCLNTILFYLQRTDFLNL